MYWKVESILAKRALIVRLNSQFINFVDVLWLWFIDAAKKYHEYLVRQEKPITDVQRVQLARNSRILQRRQRVGFFNTMWDFVNSFSCYSCLKGVRNMQLGMN